MTRRVSETEDMALLDVNVDHEVRWASVGAQRWLVLISWRLLLDSLASRTDAAGDVQTVNDLRQLQGLAQLQDSNAFIPVRPEQLGPEAPRLIGHLIRLVDDASKRISETEWAARSQRRWEWGLFHYMTLGGFSGWFGWNYDYWARYGRTPLWFGFQQDAWNDREEEILRKFRPLGQKNPPKYIDEDGIVPIYVLTGAGYESVLDDVVRQLKEIADLLQAP